MTPEQWERIKELVEAGLEREGEARSRFLDQACAGEPSLRAEVVELIASHERAGSFMAAPAAEMTTRLLADEPAESLVGRLDAELIAVIGCALIDMAQAIESLESRRLKVDHLIAFHYGFGRRKWR